MSALRASGGASNTMMSPRFTSWKSYESLLTRHAVADLQRRGHRLRRDVEGLEQERLDDERDRERDRDEHDPLEDDPGGALAWLPASRSAVAAASPGLTLGACCVPSRPSEDGPASGRRLPDPRDAPRPVVGRVAVAVDDEAHGRGGSGSATRLLLGRSRWGSTGLPSSHVPDRAPGSARGRRRTQDPPYRSRIRRAPRRRPSRRPRAGSEDLRGGAQAEQQALEEGVAADRAAPRRPVPPGGGARLSVGRLSATHAAIGSRRSRTRRSSGVGRYTRSLALARRTVAAATGSPVSAHGADPVDRNRRLGLRPGSSTPRGTRRRTRGTRAPGRRPGSSSRRVRTSSTRARPARRASTALRERVEMIRGTDVHRDAPRRTERPLELRERGRERTRRSRSPGRRAAPDRPRGARAPRPASAGAAVRSTRRAGCSPRRRRRPTTSMSRSAVYGGRPHIGSSSRSCSSSASSISKRSASSASVTPGCARIHGTSASIRCSRAPDCRSGLTCSPQRRPPASRPAATPPCRSAARAASSTSACSSRPSTQVRKASRFTTRSSTTTAPSSRALDDRVVTQRRRRPTRLGSRRPARCASIGASSP